MSETNDAEQLDPTVLGETLSDEGLPGIKDYPPEKPLAVEDPAILQGGSGTEDDLLTREWRHQEEGLDAGHDEEGLRLLPVSTDASLADDEGQALADSASPTDTPSAEEAALRIDE